MTARVEIFTARHPAPRKPSVPPPTGPLLRLALGRALGVAPASVRLVRGPHGRPELAPGMWAGQGKPPSCNASRAQGPEGGLVVVALCREAQVGVDVEHPARLGAPADQVRELPGLMDLCLAPAERDWVVDAPPQARPLRFARLWRLKEAASKALGLGLLLDPRLLAFALDGERPVLAAHGEARALFQGPWTFLETELPGGFGLAVAVAAPGGVLGASWGRPGGAEGLGTAPRHELVYTQC